MLFYTGNKKWTVVENKYTDGETFYCQKYCIALYQLSLLIRCPVDGCSSLEGKISYPFAPCPILKYANDHIAGRKPRSWHNSHIQGILLLHLPACLLNCELKLCTTSINSELIHVLANMFTYRKNRRINEKEYLPLTVRVNWLR